MNTLEQAGSLLGQAASIFIQTKHDHLGSSVEIFLVGKVEQPSMIRCFLGQITFLILHTYFDSFSGTSPSLDLSGKRLPKDKSRTCFAWPLLLLLHRAMASLAEVLQKHGIEQDPCYSCSFIMLSHGKTT